MQPTPVTPVPASYVLDQEFAENSAERLRALGARNTEPPLPRSAFLKNTKTGLVLPWTIGLATQRDIMVNCDASGNTDPVAWMGTVNPEPYSDEEASAMMDVAMRSVTNPHVSIRVAESHPVNPVPEGTMPLAEFMAARNQELVTEFENAL